MARSKTIPGPVKTFMLGQRMDAQEVRTYILKQMDFYAGINATAGKGEAYWVALKMGMGREEDGERAIAWATEAGRNGVG